MIWTAVMQAGLKGGGWAAFGWRSQPGPESGPAARKRMPVRGDKQEPGLPERAANGQAGAEPVSRRSPYCWYLRPWQAARTCMWTA